MKERIKQPRMTTKVTNISLDPFKCCSLGCISKTTLYIDCGAIPDREDQRWDFHPYVSGFYPEGRWNWIHLDANGMYWPKNPNCPRRYSNDTIKGLAKISLINRDGTGVCSQKRTGTESLPLTEVFTHVLPKTCWKAFSYLRSKRSLSKRGSASGKLGAGGFFGLSRFKGMKVTRPVFSLSIKSWTLEAVSSVSTTTWNKLESFVR